MPRTKGKYSDFCPRVKTLVEYSFGGRFQRVIPIRCKCWTCPHCRRKNLGMLIHQLDENPPERFLTLTCKPKLLETPLQAYNRCRPMIRKLFEKARRLFGCQEYAIFCELHRSGFPHWHILQRGGYIPQHWLSKTWESLTGARIVDIRKCFNARESIRYVTKYVTKATGMERLDPKFRIVTFSKHFRKPREKKRFRDPGLVEFMNVHPLDVLQPFSDKYAIYYSDGSFLVDTHTSCNSDGDWRDDWDSTEPQGVHLDAG